MTLDKNGHNLGRATIVREEWDAMLPILKASQQPVKAKCGCKHEDRFDCEYMDENKNCAINKKG